MKITRLITCDRLIEATFIKDRLNNEGIYCMLTNEISTTLLPHYNNMLGAGIHIMVLENDYDKAREILKDKLEPNAVEMICYHCGSNKIGIGIGRGKGLKILNVFISLLFTIPMGNMKPEYYCKSCKKEIG